MMERVPIVGTAGFRQNQQEAAKGAAENFAGQYGQGGKTASEIVQGSINAKADAAKKVANNMYSDLAAKADEKGAVAIPETLRAIDDAISKESSRVVPDKGVIDYLGQVKEGLS